MSNLIYGEWRQYYQVPYLPDDIERRLSLAAYRYYTFLCRAMNTHSATELHFSNEEISALTGIRDHKTLSKARSELQLCGLVDCRKVPPGIYAHTMLNEQGEPMPAPANRKGVRHYDAKTLPRKGKIDRRARKDNGSWHTPADAGSELHAKDIGFG
jgi:hypothetical protein